MPRCNRATKLEVHHRRRDGGNAESNAQVLCQECHSYTSTYGVPGDSPEPFSQFTKSYVLTMAGQRCECESDRGCH
jgi:hypothetical protein